MLLASEVQMELSFEPLASHRERPVLAYRGCMKCVDRISVLTRYLTSRLLLPSQRVR